MEERRRKERTREKEGREERERHVPVVPAI
jgi:hypothetical protein